MADFLRRARAEVSKFIDDDDAASTVDFDDGASVDSESLDPSVRYERAAAKIVKYQKKFAGTEILLPIPSLSWPFSR